MASTVAVTVSPKRSPSCGRMLAYRVRQKSESFARALKRNDSGSANREVGVPGKCARHGRRPLQRFGKFFGISQMSERNVRPAKRAGLKDQRYIED
jgi:hypothetical protein